ncbi:hypothetical protein DA798_09920 [Lactobacillus sp. PFC-70]|nr:hypothetical protein DA798_09920 [Lactobacillus sp. PFC-70]
MGTLNLAVRLGRKRLSSVVWVIRGSFPDYPKAELGDLEFSGLQVVPTTFQPLPAQPVRRVMTTVCPLAKRKKGVWDKTPKRLLFLTIMISAETCAQR